MVMLCQDCMTPTRLHTWKEVNWEHVGEGMAKREELYEESVCCQAEVIVLTDYQVADSISDIVPENTKFYSCDETLDAMFTGDITDMEQALLIEYFQNEKFVVRATKLTDEPTEQQKNDWIIYCWMEAMLDEHCNYNTDNYTEYKVYAIGNKLQVRWRL